MSGTRFPKPADKRTRNNGEHEPGDAGRGGAEKRRDGSRESGEHSRSRQGKDEGSRRTRDEGPRRAREDDRPRRDHGDRPSRGADDSRPKRDDRSHHGPGDRPRRGGDDSRPKRDDRARSGPDNRPRHGGDDGRVKRDDRPRYGHDDRSRRAPGDEKRPRRDDDRRGPHSSFGGKPAPKIKKREDEALWEAPDFDAISIDDLEPMSIRETAREKAPKSESAEAQREAPALVPGAKPVIELLESAPQRIDTVFLRKGRHSKEMDQIADACRVAGVRFSLLEAAVFAKIYPGKSQGVVARLFEAGFTDFDEMLDRIMDAPMPLIVVLDQVQDPGNAGTLARSLYALGGAGLVVPRHNGVYLGPAASKASAGALEKLPVSKVASLSQAIDAAKERGITVYGAAEEARDAADTKKAVPVHDIFSLVPRLPAMLLLGGEEDGLRQGMEKRCDALIRIPMLRDFDSLNVAQAGAIILAWLSHRVAEKK